MHFRLGIAPDNLTTNGESAMPTRSLPLHAESSALVPAPPGRVFDYLDDPLALAAHMSEPSAMMTGSRMSAEVDARGGREVGSKISMSGRMMGLELSLEEVVTERRPPYAKVWETIGSPKLVVIAQYRMGFEVTPSGDAALVRVFVDYRLPPSGPGLWLGRLLGGVYARWCVQSMSRDAARHFSLEGAVAGKSPA
jgi:hypothetical protein